MSNPKERAPKPKGIFILSRLTSVGREKNKNLPRPEWGTMTFTQPGYCVKRKFLKIVFVQEIRQFTVPESKHSKIGSQGFLG